MKTRCAECGSHGSEQARFCEQCGTALITGATPLRAPSALAAKILEQGRGLEGERKQVTVMYADVVGSMDLTQSLGAERWAVVLDRFLGIAAGAVHAYEGTVNQFTGDGLLAVFGAPLAYEDHAQRACMAVLELQRAAAVLAAEVARSDGAEFAVRCGLNSGQVVVGAIGDDVHMDFVPIGNTTALGKRIESVAPPGSATVSASTAALVEGEFELRDLGEFELKGVPGRQRVLELIGVGKAQTRFAATAATRGLSRFVGRQSETAQLDAALERALAGEGGAIGIVGDPGIGKSRLVHEFVSKCSARGLAINSTAGVTYGRHNPLLPMLALWRDAFGIDERDAPETVRQRVEKNLLELDPALAAELPLMFELLGVPDPARPLGAVTPEAQRERLLDLVTHTVKARSRREMVVVVVEDLQWLDEASAACLDRLADAVIGTQTLLVCTYRPEHESAWAGHAQLRLGPLGSGATDALVTELLGHDESIESLAASIEARAGGNPFFIEEIVHMLVDDRRLAGARGRHRLVGALESAALPVTIQAGLAARIDRLPDREKALLQVMSVIGAEIPEQLLCEVSGLDAGVIAGAIEALTREQFVVLGRGDCAFKHPLAREVAYGSQLSDQRTCTHRTVAAAIERTYPDELNERAAVLAHHYEAAGDMPNAARWLSRARHNTRARRPRARMALARA